MRIPVAAVAAASFVLLIGATPPVDQGIALIAAVDAKNADLPDYTFQADVAVAMHHFPWLHFNLVGDGTHQRGGPYAIHFTRMPWFAKQIHDVDLSPLDPGLWPKTYTYEAVGTDGDDTIFELHALHDPSLQQARVALSAQGADWVDETYADGTHIRMTVVPAVSDGYLLPSQLDVAIDCPHMPLTAKASFSGYEFKPAAAP